jgi:hypothetical protein
MMKLNLGCGFNKLPGFVNVDRFDSCTPDLVFDLEQPAWPWASNSVTELVFNHSLEHIGQISGVFLRIMQEVYRVCAPDAVVRINAPHPRHDNFINDPTHVRIITPMMLALFDRENNFDWIAGGHANSTLGLYLDVDFVITEIVAVPAPRYAEMLAKKMITSEELETLAGDMNNVIEEYRIVLKARKPLYQRPST